MLSVSVIQAEKVVLVLLVLYLHLVVTFQILSLRLLLVLFRYIFSLVYITADNIYMNTQLSFRCFGVLIRNWLNVSISHLSIGLLVTVNIYVHWMTFMKRITLNLYL